MALMSFLFIGLNVVRLKLSRDHLEKAVRDARAQINSLQHDNMIERNIAADLQRKIDLINVCRPLARTTSVTLTDILAASINERKEMIRTHQQVLANQRREGREDGVELSYTFSATQQQRNGLEHSIDSIDLKDNEGSAPNAKAIGRSLLATTTDGTTTAVASRARQHVPTIVNDPSDEVFQLPGTPSRESSVVKPSSSPPRMPSHEVNIAASHVLETKSPTVPVLLLPPNVSVNGTTVAAGHSSSSVPVSSLTTDALGHKYSVTITDRAQAPSPSTAALSNHHSGTGTPEPGQLHHQTLNDVATATGDEATLIKGALADGYANIRDSEITLDIILGHPVTVELIKDRLSQLHAPETLIFYLEVQHYKRAPVGHLKKMAMDIHDYYIQADAENQVNFSSTLRALLSKRVKEPSPGATIFKEAEREAHRLLMQNAWPTFRASPEFQVCAMILRGLAAPLERGRTTL
jgi:hypothetical protein